MKRSRNSTFLLRVLFIAGSTLLAAGRTPAVERPFILWNKKDIAAVRKKIEGQAWARKAYEKLINEPERHERTFSNLLRYAITGDKEIAQSQIKELVRTARSPVPRGAAQYINVIRYDMFYDSLTPEERRDVERFFREYIENHIFKRVIFDPNIFNNSANYARYDAREYTRTNWLPNITWPWKVSANLMAAALQDEKLIRKVWTAYGSWKWYFDEYLCDIGFYSEEFGKMGSTPGAMLLYCRALERLGLNELGFGYKGKGGATMRGHIESLIHLGYPRLDVGGSRPQYPMVTMGDLRQSGSSQSWNLPSPAFQHSIVRGYTRDGAGGNERWKAHGAWGGVRRGKLPQWDGYSGFTPKMQIPLWFEFGHGRWPDLRFDYFLARMRGPDEENYYPSLFFGLDPIDPAKVKAPPAPSAVWTERGMVILRADESPAYWESAAPAVAMRLGSNYAHHVNDCFALLGFYAFNRPIYLNRQVTPGYAMDWSRSIQSHCAVTADGKEPEFTDATTTRRAFTEKVKFVAARSKQVYPGVDLTRCLMLTGEYLLDVTRLAAQEEHSYYWLIHALGEAEVQQSGKWNSSKLPHALLHPLKKMRACDIGDRGWAVTAQQNCTLDNVAEAKLPGQWYQRKIGVRMNMLAEEGTKAYVAQTPLIVRKYRDKNGERRYEEVPSEVGGVTIIAERKAPCTTFIALHEPFEAGKPQIVDFTPIELTDRGLAVAVAGRAGSAINDRLMVRLGDDYEQPLTLDSGSESFTFADWAYVRIGTEKVEVWGRLRRMKLQVEGRPKLMINGKKQKASIAGQYLSYGMLPP
jgi:hypothetical protein